MLPELRFRIIVVMQLIRNKSILEKMSSNSMVYVSLTIKWEVLGIILYASP